jgi:hypothetical protein
VERAESKTIDPNPDDHPAPGPPPSFVTAPGRDYFDYAFETLSLFHFVLDLTVHSDYAAFVAKEVLEDRDAPKGLTPLDLASKNPGPRTRFIRKRSQALLEMILTRMVDGFNTYTSEIIRAALRARPEVLRSNEQVRLDYVLKFASFEQLREDLVDRKVLELGYKGFHDLDEWCQSRLGIASISAEEASDELTELIETRNAISHARGRVGPKYHRLVPGSAFKLGEVRTLSVDYLYASARLLFDTVASMDKEIASKFGLSTSTYVQSKEKRDD